jgi:hypothetical protein
VQRYSSLSLIFILLACAWLLSACAGTARGLSSSALKHDESLSMVDNSLSQADALVVIRYPAMVDQDAVGEYYRSFASSAIGGSMRSDVPVGTETSKIAQAIIAKSNYYAMSLFRALRDDLPADSVLLSPHMIVRDEEGELTSRPLLATEQIPSVITIDFNVYSFPDPQKMMDSPPLTFGDIVTPLFVIHANRWLRPSTHGLLLSSNPLVNAAWVQSEQQAEGQFISRWYESTDEFSRPLDFVTFLNRSAPPARDLPLKSLGEARRDVIAVEDYPLEKIRMNGEIVAVLTVDHSTDPFAEDFVNGASTRIVMALNEVDHDRATFFDRQKSLARFDPELANAFLARSNDERTRSRLAMAETLVTAERKFLSAQSASLFEGTYEGVYGEQMRQMISAEYRLLEERRSLARAQNISTALAVVAMAGAVYSGSNSNSGNFVHSRTTGNILMLSSLWAANSAMAANAESKTIGQNFLTQMAPAINRQVSVQVEWLESRQEISARDFGEFREKTLGLYQSSVRSIDHSVDRSCKFFHPGLDYAGRWFGTCVNGQASASGYGMVTDGEGEFVEFVGSAASGVASGTGAMIIRSAGATGAIYYEGGFSAGLPDGVVLVEEPGRKARTRLYKAGKDAGAADEAGLQRLRF